MGKRLDRLIKDECGASPAYILLTAAVVIFLILPIFSFVMEKYTASIKAQEIMDTLDITNIATYNALSLESASMAGINFNSSDALNLYKDLLAKNLRLNTDLTPTASSIAAGKVNIDELTFYISGFPVVCSNGKELKRPTVHAKVTVPIKPFLYRAFILNAMGKDYVSLQVHVDSELPINN